VVIRHRHAADDEAIRQLNDLAFGGSYESALVASLRAANLAVIECVATDDNTEIAGHILLSRLAVSVDGRTLPTLALAPMSVRPDRQRQGIGGALIRAGLECAREEGWQAMIVLGHPTYYRRFGFSAEKTRHLQAPFRGAAFMALELAPGALDGKSGSVVYPPAFGLGRR